MAYKATIPVSTDQLDVSQGDLLANFTELNTVMGVNHYTFNTGNDGKHKTAIFPQAAAPAAAGAAEVGLYSKSCTIGANPAAPEFYINKTALQTPFTAADKSATGWTYLPSGVILKWGQGVTGTPIVWTSAGNLGDFMTACFTVSPTLFTAGTLHYWIELSAIATTGFTAHAEDGNGNAAAVAFYYLAIGH